MRRAPCESDDDASRGVSGCEPGREPAPRRDGRYAFRIGVLAVPLFRLLADWGYYSVAGADCATNTELHVRRRRSLSLSVVYF